MREWLGGMGLIALVVGAVVLISSWEPAELVVVAALLLFGIVCVVYGLIWLWAVAKGIAWFWRNGRLGDMFARGPQYRSDLDTLDPTNIEAAERVLRNLPIDSIRLDLPEDPDRGR